MSNRTIPMARLVAQLDSKRRAEYIKNIARPNKGKNEDILNFQFYFNKYTTKKGSINGPELLNNSVYISVYHFLEYEGYDPNEYDTFAIGLDMFIMSQDIIPCFYEDYPKTDKINKYKYEFLINNINIIISNKYKI